MGKCEWFTESDRTHKSRFESIDRRLTFIWHLPTSSASSLGRTKYIIRPVPFLLFSFLFFFLLAPCDLCRPVRLTRLRWLNYGRRMDLEATSNSLISYISPVNLLPAGHPFNGYRPGAQLKLTDPFHSFRTPIIS